MTDVVKQQAAERVLDWAIHATTLSPSARLKTYLANNQLSLMSDEAVLINTGKRGNAAGVIWLLMNTAGVRDINTAHLLA